MSVAASSVPSGSLTVLLPVHNEAPIIEDVLQEVESTVVEPAEATLLVCEDGSSDASADVLRRFALEHPMQLTIHRERLGYGGAASFGMQKVETPFVFFMDSDGQYDPSDFWHLWQKAGRNDMVIGCKTRRAEPLHRTVLSRGFHLLVRAVTGVRLDDMDCGFRIVRREVWQALLPQIDRLKYSFWAEFSIRASVSGFAISEVPVSHRPRRAGATTIYPLRKLPGIIIAQVVGLLRLAKELQKSPETKDPRRVSGVEGRRPA